MSVARLQSNSNSSNVSVSPLTAQTVSLTVAFPSNVTAGDTIIVAVGVYVEGPVNGATTPSVTDSAGNLYTQIQWVDSSYHLSSSGLFIAKNVLGGADTITFSYSASNGNNLYPYSFDQFVAVAEYSGLGSSPTLQSSAVAQTTSATSASLAITDSSATPVTVTLNASSALSGALADIVGGGVNFLVACGLGSAISISVSPSGYCVFSLAESPTNSGHDFYYWDGTGAVQIQPCRVHVCVIT
jgi:hypothetical protein